MSSRALLWLVLPCIGVLACARTAQQGPSAPAVAPQQATIWVGTTDVQAGALPKRHLLSARLEAHRITQVVSAIPGTIEKRFVDDGDAVRSRQTLFRLESSRQRIAVESAQIAVDAAKVDVDWLTKDRDRKADLVKTGDVSSIEFDAAEYQLLRAQAGLKRAEVGLKNARRALSDTIITATASGIVTARAVDEGQTIGPGVPLLLIVDLSALQARVMVSSENVALLSVGDRVEVDFSDSALATVAGVVGHIPPRADMRSGLFEVIIRLDTPPKGARAGMAVDVRLSSVNESPKESLLVPTQAVLASTTGSEVFVIKGGRAMRRSVTLGKRSERWVEVLSGLGLGETVAVDGIGSLEDGAHVKPERRAIAPPAVADHDSAVDDAKRSDAGSAPPAPTDQQG